MAIWELDGKRIPVPPQGVSDSKAKAIETYIDQTGKFPAVIARVESIYYVDCHYTLNGNDLGATYIVNIFERSTDRKTIHSISEFTGLTFDRACEQVKEAMQIAQGFNMGARNE